VKEVQKVCRSMPVGIAERDWIRGTGVAANAGRVGIRIAPEHAIQWLTANPAKAMGILDRTGTLEAGKMADVVVWNGSPFSSYAQAEQVYVDGARMYDRHDPSRQPKSDFMLGQDIVRGGVQ
jgi:predicted amidohydrolase YtcJ